MQAITLSIFLGIAGNVVTLDLPYCKWINPEQHWRKYQWNHPYWRILSSTWWRHQVDTFFLRYWPFVRGIHRSPVNSPHKGQWRWALMFSLICSWTNCWENNRNADDLGRHCANYDVNVMSLDFSFILISTWRQCFGCILSVMKFFVMLVTKHKHLLNEIMVLNCENVKVIFISRQINSKELVIPPLGKLR